MNKQQKLLTAIGSGIFAVISLLASIFLFIAAIDMQRQISGMRDFIGEEASGMLTASPDWITPIFLLFVGSGLAYLSYYLLK